MSATVPAAVGKISVTAPAMSLTIVDLAAFKARQGRGTDPGRSCRYCGSQCNDGFDQARQQLVFTNFAADRRLAGLRVGLDPGLSTSSVTRGVLSHLFSSRRLGGILGSAVLTVAAGATSAFAPANSSRRADASAAHASGATTGPPLPPPCPARPADRCRLPPAPRTGLPPSSPGPGVQLSWS